MTYSYENNLTGCLLLDPGCIVEILGLVKPEMFKDGKNKLIFQTMVEAFETNNTLDMIDIQEKTQIPASYLTAIAGEVVSSAGVVKYAKKARDGYLRRTIYQGIAKNAKLLHNEAMPLEEVLGKIEGVISIDESGADIREMSDLAVNRWEDQKEGKRDVGVKTGFCDLDRLLGCFKNGELVIIAGRTSMGKTTLALDIARQVAQQENTVLVFSLEMSAERVADRLICAKALVGGQVYRNMELTEEMQEKIDDAIGQVYTLPVKVCDKRVTTLELKAKALRVKAKFGLKMIIVDFITLLKDKRDSRTSTADHVGEIAKNLQETAKELNVPVVALSQMNREIEKRSNKRPQLSDLRDSGNIEEAADVVIFVHRPEYFDENGDPELIIGKNRDGPTGTVELKYFDHIPTFRDRGWMNGEGG